MLLKVGQWVMKELCYTPRMAAAIGSTNGAKRTIPSNVSSFLTVLTAGPSVSAGRSLRLVPQTIGPLLLVLDTNFLLVLTRISQGILHRSAKGAKCKSLGQRPRKS